MPLSTSTDPASDTVPVDVVVWGLGTGRHLRRLVREGLRVRVLAIDLAEPTGDAIAARLAARPEVLHAWRRRRLEIVTGPPAKLAAAFSACQGARVYVHAPALDDTRPEAAALARGIERVHEARLSARGQVVRLRSNLRHNLPHIAAAHGIDHLRGRAAGGAILVVAAGPSLDRFLPVLAQAARHHPTIVVDTALPVLSAAKIPVDLAVCVDPHPTTEDHFATVAPSFPLAFFPYVWPSVPASFPPGFVAFPDGDRFLDACAKDLGLPVVAAGGTVLLFALQIAAACEPDLVVLVGADLAVPGGRTHARGCAHARAADEAVLKTRRSDGVPVPTTRALRRFQDVVERHIRTARPTHLALDGGGAALAGAVMIDPQGTLAALDRYRRDTQSPRSTFHPPPPRPAFELEARLARLRARLAEFDTLADRANDR